jgi:hypothetical protein
MSASVDLAESTTARRVFIGQIPHDDPPDDERCRCLPLPFQYADLIAAIEELARPSG